MNTVSSKPWRWTIVLLLVMLQNACITINIYFPAAAAEKAADKVIDEIWQTLPDGTGNTGKAASPANTEAPVPSAPAASPASTGVQP